MATTMTDAFADAHAMYTAALERLSAGDIRDAAEKAWCASKRATDGLIFARTGEEPRTSTATSAGLRRLMPTDSEVRGLRRRYLDLQATLHGECFYYGLCDPVDETELLIRETIDFIREAERLADA